MKNTPSERQFKFLQNLHLQQMAKTKYKQSFDNLQRTGIKL